MESVDAWVRRLVRGRAPRAIDLKQAEIWHWLPDEGIYRHALTGHTISQDGMRKIARSYQARANLEMRALADRLASGAIDLNTWELAMRQEIKDTYINIYMLGRGGRAEMTFADWGSNGGMLSNQYRYLRGFRDDIAAGYLSPGQIGARSELYINSSSQALERAISRTEFGWELILPAYPGDGSTLCLTNCRCNWDIIETDTEWLCYWRLGIAEHCPDCLERGQIWNPFVILK